jgi:hypothetical protein
LLVGVGFADGALVGEALRMPPAKDWAFPEWAHPVFEVLEALAACDPDAAEQAAAELADIGAEVQIDWIPHRAFKALAVGLAQADPRRAEQTASRLLDQARNDALTAVAEALTRVDPDEAERIADGIHDAQDRERALVAVGKAMAEQHPHHAERLAREKLGLHAGAPVLAAVGQAVALTDPARAERLAADLLEAARDDPSRSAASLLMAAATTLARVDLDRAQTVAGEIDDWYTPYEFGAASPLAAVAAAAAAVDPDCAEQITDRIVTRYSSYNADRVAALAAVATTVADTGDVDRALRIANKASQLAEGMVGIAPAPRCACHSRPARPGGGAHAGTGDPRPRCASQGHRGGRDRRGGSRH